VSLTISSINVYPVKSTAGQLQERARVEGRGLEHDRRWMVIDAGGEFVTGREVPALVRIRATPRKSGLTLEAPGVDPLFVADAGGAEPLTVTVWRDRVEARRVDRAADAWLQSVLGIPCALVRMPETTRRTVDPEHGAPGDTVSFADGYPLLLIGDASLADLNTRAPAPVEMARFRPNLTVSGSAAFAEDGWRRIRVGTVQFEAPKACDRCVMTTVDPRTGIKDEALEPLRTLSTYRRDRARGILFGVNLIPRGEGEIALGDSVEVLD
jgi:uncharacterized protein YcbX